MKDDFFSFANRVFSQEFFHLVWLKYWNNIPRLLFYPFQDNQETKRLQHPKTPMPQPFLLMEPTLSALASVHCFDCCLDSGV